MATPFQQRVLAAVRKRANTRGEVNVGYDAIADDLGDGTLPYEVRMALIALNDEGFFEPTPRADAARFVARLARPSSVHWTGTSQFVAGAPQIVLHASVGGMTVAVFVERKAIDRYGIERCKAAAVRKIEQNSSPPKEIAITIEDFRC